MKKALIVSTVSRQFTLFERGNIAILKELGYEVHCAANYSHATKALNELDIVRHHIDIQRSPFSPKQIKAFFQLKNLMSEQKFDLVHCHAPMGGVLGRICSKVTNTSPVLYTAHGFHFYKGAPIINNIIYKNIESTMAKLTDALITINSEDFASASNFNLRKNGKVYKIPGVGVNTEIIKKNDIDLLKKKEELDIKNNEIVLISVGELNSNKNHKVIIEAINLLDDTIKKRVKYILCGVGDREEELRQLAIKYKLDKNVMFLGYRSDVVELLKISDIFVFPSRREGLSKSIMEAMTVGLPIVASKIRGNVDLIEENLNGYLIDPNDYKKFSEKLGYLINNKSIVDKIKSNNLMKSEKFDTSVVNKRMNKIYCEHTKKGE